MAGPFEAVVFDNDGLLLDTEEAWTRAEETLFERHGGSFTLEHKRALIGTSPATSAAKLEAMLDLPGRGPALVDELHDLVMEEALAGVPPRPGALELLDAVRAAGLPGRCRVELRAGVRGARPVRRRPAGRADSATGVAAAVAAGMYVVAVPYFPDLPIEGASLTSDSLADPHVAEVLGVRSG